MSNRRRKRSLIMGVIALVLASPSAVHSDARGLRKHAEQLDEQLVKIAIRLYELNLEVPALYARAFGKEHAEAGEGLFAELFSDPIIVLQLAIRIGL